MKKFVSILLVLVLMMSLSVAAFASEVETDQGTTAPTYTDHETVTINKVYTLVGAGTSPAETFTLVQVGSEVKDGEATSAPALGTITGAAFADGAATVNGTPGDITVVLPTYEHVGVYEYTLQEVAGTTAGVTYYGNNIKLVVTVVNGNDGNLRIAAVHTESAGETKSDSFTNTYAANSLTVKKVVAGNLGDKSKEFTATVTFTSSKEVKSTITGAATIAPADWSNDAATGIWTASANITIKHGNANDKTFNNIPAGVNYSVAEIVGTDGKVDGKYVVSYDNNKEGVITADAAASTTITNTYDKGSIDMGVSMDSLPYILMLVVVGAAVVVIATRKKGEQF